MVAVPNYIPPTSDYSTGYTILPSDWNGNFDNIAQYLNTQVAPNLNLALGATNPPVFQARLTATTGVPFPTVDVASAANLYLTACYGNQIALYNVASSSFINTSLAADVTLNVPAATRDLFDVYIYSNAGILTLMSSGYYTQAVTNSPSAGSSIVCDVAATAHFNIGDVVSIYGGGNSEDAVVTAVNTNTSVTLDWLAHAYTAPTLSSNTPTVPLAMVQGVPVNSADNSKRFVGTILVIASVVTDSVSIRGIGNFYNKVARPISRSSGGYTQLAGSHAIGSVANKNALSQMLFVHANQSQSSYWSVNRALNTTAGTCVTNTDNVFYGVTSYAGAGSGIPLCYGASGHVSVGGRHAITDWWTTGGGTVPFDNSYGQVLN